MKRKRDEVEQDPKLKEFLEIYQPPSKTNIWTDGDAQIAAGNHVPVENSVQDVVVPADESDDEYQVIAKKPKTVDTQPSPVTVLANSTEGHPAETLDATMPDAPDAPDSLIATTDDQPATTDDDWLRSKTNRLLDLVQDDDVPITPASAPTKPATEKRASPAPAEQQTEPAQPSTESTAGFASSEEDKIRETGRLYLRNLHFEVAEDDIKMHFSKYGSLDEVSNALILHPTRL